MTPIATPEDNERPPEKEFDVLPPGYCVMIVEDSAYESTKKDGTHAPRIKVQLKPLNLMGNYGSIFLYLPLDPAYNTLEFCEATGLSKNRSFDPGVRMNEHPDNPSAWDEHKIALNLHGRVCECLMKPDTYQGRKKSAIDIFNRDNKPFKPYVVNGESYSQPPIITNANEPPNPGQATASEQQTLAPPSEETVTGDDGEEMTIEPA